jgi:hypothetical protein
MIFFAQKLSLFSIVSIGSHEIIWLLSRYCVQCPISKGQGNELPVGLLSNETSVQQVAAWLNAQHCQWLASLLV